MNPRMMRLHADHEKIYAEFAHHPFVTVVPGAPRSPPERYTVTYRVPGLRWDSTTNRAVVANEHVAEIYLHAGYPREKPKCVMKTPVWHPNFGSYICIGDHWSAGETIVDIIVQIGDMLQYRTYNPRSPVNRIAAQWALENASRFPVGNLNILQPQREGGLDGGARRARKGALEITLKPSTAGPSPDVTLL